MEFEKVTLHFIEARTGCSCCSYDNFYMGPFMQASEADELIEKWSKGIDNPLCSQFSKYGNYHRISMEGEALGDGRYIVGNSVWGQEIEQRKELDY